MMRGYLMILVLAAMLMPAAVSVPAGRAAAQPKPTIVLSPPSGPCDAPVEVTGSGFEPGAEIPLDLGAPHSDVSMGRLAVAAVEPDGQFSVEVTFGSLGCEAAARDTELDHPGERKELVIFAGYDPAREFIITRAPYHYTTTSPSVARVLPPAGDGSGALRRSGPTAVIPALAGVAGVLLVAGLCATAAAGKMRRPRC